MPKPEKKKAPTSNASREEHRKFAVEALEDPEYKQKPADYKDKNDVPKDRE